MKVLIYRNMRYKINTVKCITLNTCSKKGKFRIDQSSYSSGNKEKEIKLEIRRNNTKLKREVNGI